MVQSQKQTAFEFGPNLLEVQTYLEKSKKIPKIRKELDEHKTQRRFIEKGSKEDREAEDRIHQLNELLKDPEDIFSIQTERIKTGVEPSSDDAMFLFYPTNRAFKRLPPRLSGVKAMSPADAYAKALDKVEISLNDFAVWFRVVKQGKLGGKSFGKVLLAMLEKTVQDMLPGFSGLLLKETPHPHFTIKKEKIRFSLEQLSDGERALLALAFDLIRRLTLANPESKNPAEEGKALVMIDEIELHLHPTWQRQVLRRLMAAFPQCQFIVTTHSPLVLGEVEARCVRYLEQNDETGKIEAFTPPESFGLDANRILDEHMGGSERNVDLAAALNNVFSMIDEEHFADARKAMVPIIKRLGENDPEITRAQSLIKFLESSE